MDDLDKMLYARTNGSKNNAIQQDPLDTMLLNRSQNGNLTDSSNVISPKKDQTFLQNASNFVDATAHNLMKPIHGAAQLVENGIASGLSKLPDNPVSKYFIDSANNDNAIIKKDEEDYQKRVPDNMYSYGGAAIGQAVPFIFGGGAALMDRAGSIGSALTGNASRAANTVMPITEAIGRGVTQGAATAALQPVTDNKGDYWNSKRDQISSGSQFGGAGGALGSILSKMIFPSVSGEVRGLLNEGIRLTPGQILGGAANRIEQGMESIPVVGDFIKNAKIRGNQDLNTASLNRALHPIHETLPDGMTGREAMEHTHDRVSNAYDNFINNTRPIVADNQFINDIGNVVRMGNLLPGDTGRQLSNIIDHNLISRIDRHGNLTIQEFKNADSLLRQTYERYIKSDNPDHHQIANAALEARSSLQDLLGRINPDKQDEYRGIRTAFANYLRPQRASVAKGAEGGIFNASQLQGSVKALDATKRKTGFSEGDALMQDLSEPALSVMGSKVPDSGTPFRNAILSLIGGSFLPSDKALMAVPVAGAASLPYTQTGQRLSQALLTQRPEIAQPVSRMVNNSAARLSSLMVPLKNNNKDKK